MSHYTTIEPENKPLTQIDAGHPLAWLAFSEDGRFLVSGDDTVRIWEVENGKNVAKTEEKFQMNCGALSRDTKYVAAGTRLGDAYVWSIDKETFQLQSLFAPWEGGNVTALDFSPDSARLIVASDDTATIWDLPTRQKVPYSPLRHDDWLRAAKYSTQGDRIATATEHSIKIYESRDGRLLVVIPTVQVSPWYNSGLLWFNNHLVVISDSKIKQIQADEGSKLISEWPIYDGSNHACIALPLHGAFIAYSANHTVTFWDMSMQKQLGVIRHSADSLIRSITLSPDDRFLTVGGEDGKITIYDLFHITCSIALPRLHPTFQEPALQICHAALDAWKCGQLTNAEALLTAEISASQDSSHLIDILAGRSLIRGRMRHWDEAIDDAKQSLEIKPSIFGYIAKSFALVGKGERLDGFRTCDIAFGRFHSTHVSFLLLIKAVIVSMSGEHNDAISRMDDLIATVPPHSALLEIQAYMYTLCGICQMKRRDYRDAIQSFQRARAQQRHRYDAVQFSLVSLISGWNFDDLGINVHQRLCEAFCAAECAEKAYKVFLEMMNTFGKEVYANGDLAKWVSDFTHHCLSIPEGAESNLRASECDIAPRSHAPLHSAPLIFLLREWTKSTLALSPWKTALIAANSFTCSKSIIYRAMCEHLEIEDRVIDSVQCLHQMTRQLEGEVNNMGWVSDLKLRCVEKLVRSGDAAVNSGRYDDGISRYTAALSLTPSSSLEILVKRSKVHMEKGSWENALEDSSEVIRMDPLSPWNCESVLMEWAKAALTNGLWSHALESACSFAVPNLMVYRAICEHLEAVDRVTEATECFHQMSQRLVRVISQDKEAQWIIDFKARCCAKLESLGNVAMSARQYDEAISKYSVALSLHPTIPQSLFVKRSQAYEGRGLWGSALTDADEVIKLDPSSPLGYESKHAALCGEGRRCDAIDAFEMMLSKMSLSSDPETHENLRRYIHPETTKVEIRNVVQDTVRDLPRVLIHTTSGRLVNKSRQATFFESSSEFEELVCSMTTQIDHTRIKHEVKQYYRYAMLSHKWEEDNEPLFHQVVRTNVYDLRKSPTHDKLQMFCKISRKAGFNWAWSDTCCIDKSNLVVLQEALFAMFRWYEGSSLTIIYLRGVRSPSKRGDLVRSVWNTRAWTFQEYHASRVARFYVEDWSPYLNLGLDNHKMSPEVISEMEEATGVSARKLLAFRPGTNHVREKLFLASRRETSQSEDAAYSLFGIFSVFLPLQYGEGACAIGRFLARLLTNSGDTSILAWTGRTGRFNSCFPDSIKVFNSLQSTHIPRAVQGAEMEALIARFRSSSLTSALVTQLYAQVQDLPVPSFAGQRMKLPCIIFKLGHLLTDRKQLNSWVFRAQTTVLGIVEITAQQDLARMEPLYLIHPWIDFLLDRPPLGGVIETTHEDDTDSHNALTGESSLSPDSYRTGSVAPKPHSAPLVVRLGRSSSGRSIASNREEPPLRPPSPMSRTDRQMQAFRFLARLSQPFGALLFTQTRKNAEEYRRVAAESRITVQIEEMTPKTVRRLIEDVRILDVL